MKNRSLWPMAAIAEIAAPIRHALNGGPFGSKLVSKMYVDEGVPVVRGGNLPFDKRFHDSDFVFVTEQKANELYAHSAVPGDVIFTQRGSLGQVGIIPANAQYSAYVISQSQMKLTVDPLKANALFIYYLFRSDEIREKLIRFASSSGVPHINLETLRNFRISLPTVREQEQISAYLSAYDDLIENNTRRIAILEEMARRLFDEFRNGSRERTTVVPLGDIADEANGTVRTGPFGSQLHEADYKPEGIPVVMPKDIISGRVSTATIARIDDETAGRLGQHRLLEGDIVYGRRGDIGRRALIRRRQAGYLCGTGCLRISIPKGRVKSRYLFAFLGLPEVVADIAGKAIGATMPNLNTSILRSIGIEVPPLDVQERFVGLVEPLDDLAEALIEANQRLRAARDLLLPKLISGEIAVGAAPLPEELAAE